MCATDAARSAIESTNPADGYNIGVNSGEAAGQTVFHLHVHVIPRRRGDVPDPRGGIRHVIPEKANYLGAMTAQAPPNAPQSTAPTRALITGGSEDPLLPQLKHHLAASKAADLAV